MNRTEFDLISPENVDELGPARLQEAVAFADEFVREWFVRCPKCGFKTIGTLRYLRGKPCGACGYGNETEQSTDIDHGSGGRTPRPSRPSDVSDKPRDST